MTVTITATEVVAFMAIIMLVSLLPPTAVFILVWRIANRNAELVRSLQRSVETTFTHIRQLLAHIQKQGGRT